MSLKPAMFQASMTQTGAEVKHPCFKTKNPDRELENHISKNVSFFTSIDRVLVFFDKFMLTFAMWPIRCAACRARGVRGQRMRKQILVLATALTAASCASTPDFQAGEVLPEAPQSWAALPQQEGMEASRDWIASLGAAELAPFVEEAFRANPSLAQSLARYDAALASARISGASRLPTLNASTDYTRTERNVGAGSESFSLGLASSWEADLWGRVRNTANASGLDAAASEQDLRGAQLSIAGQVARAWFSLIEARLQTELAQRDFETQRDTLALTERRFARGLVRSSDVRTARSSVASAEATLASRRRNEAASARTLETLLGRYPAARIARDGEMPDMGDLGYIGSPEDLLTRRPDVVAAERRLEAAGLRVDAARAALYPSLTLSASAGSGGPDASDLLDMDTLVSTLVGSIAQPIFQGGRLRAQVDQAEANAEQAIAAYVETVLTAWREAENAIYADQILAQRVDSLEQAFQEAAEAEALVTRQYARGVATIFDLLNAYSRRISAESQYISAHRDRATNRVDLYLAIAGDFVVAGAPAPTTLTGE